MGTETAIISMVESNKPLTEKDISFVLREYGVSLKPIEWRKQGQKFFYGGGIK
jgi:hypothetical protein